MEGLGDADIISMTIKNKLACITLAVDMVIQVMISGGFITFRFTLLPLHTCVPVVLAFAVLILYRYFKNLGNQSIMEWLWMD